MKMFHCCDLFTFHITINKSDIFMSPQTHYKRQPRSLTEFALKEWSKREIYIICRPGGPYWEKLCQRSWVRPEAAGLGPCSRPRAQFFSIRTDQGRQIIFLFFSCCFSKVKRVLLFSESNVLQARVKWTMKRSRLWHQSSKIRFFTLLKLRNHGKQYN